MADVTIVPVADVGSTVWTGTFASGGSGPPLYQYINHLPINGEIDSDTDTTSQHNYVAALGVSANIPSAALVGRCRLRVDALCGFSGTQYIEVDILENGTLRLFTTFKLTNAVQSYFYYPSAAELASFTSGSDIQMRFWRLSTATPNRVTVGYAEFFIPDSAISMAASGGAALGATAAPQVIGDVQMAGAGAMSLGSVNLLDVQGDVLLSASGSMGLGQAVGWQFGTVPASRRDYPSDMPGIVAPVSRRDRPADR
jgi:hypothetical protein